MQGGKLVPDTLASRDPQEPTLYYQVDAQNSKSMASLVEGGVGITVHLIPQLSKVAAHLIISN